MAVATANETYERIAVRPVAGALGAEIDGVDLAGPIDAATFEEILRAFLEHLVIFFRDQNLPPAAQKAFAARFGSLNVHPFVKPLDGHPEVMKIVKEKDDRANFGGGWHSDMSFLPEPCLGTILHALDVPAHGGDTLFANMYMEGLTAIHSAASQYGLHGESSKNNSRRSGMEIAVTEEARAEAEHPVVRTHPETGRKCLFVNGPFTVKFKGMTRRESKPLMEFLCAHATQEEFTCRFRWTKGAVAFWDNRCTQHYALNDYHGQRREMNRVTVNGDRPR